jgi:hypothetical protein
VAPLADFWKLPTLDNLPQGPGRVADTVCRKYDLSSPSSVNTHVAASGLEEGIRGGLRCRIFRRKANSGLAKEMQIRYFFHVKKLDRYGFHVAGPVQELARETRSARGLRISPGSRSQEGELGWLWGALWQSDSTNV